MQANVMQFPIQPFIKLVQSNMELLSKYSMSPEVISQAMTHAQSLFQQGQGAATNLSQSSSFALLMQGMLKNYTEFMAEMAQSGMAMLAQGQAAMVQKAQEAADVVDASSARARRTR